MTQDSKIQKALDMIDNYDWFWSMSDKAGMRRFVALVNTIEDEDVRKALRGLWSLRYEETSSIISGRHADVSAQRNEYMAVLAA